MKTDIHVSLFSKNRGGVFITAGAFIRIKYGARTVEVVVNIFSCLNRIGRALVVVVVLLFYVHGKI